MKSRWYCYSDDNTCFPPQINARLYSQFHGGKRGIVHASCHATLFGMGTPTLKRGSNNVAGSRITKRVLETA
ncbi:hypothetical protein DPX39_090088000 [Trypanosoma brucei equiperdum]|uniref:Uncharacterized protein n=1 Tax=Trypanosoma brucei equiperdum TaxID=630700 RepID=A0A3L6L161_9TRYP|nr:hypothetical protein DPX39_090088000 [Trypanosoma brucei equiperdum]